MKKALSILYIILAAGMFFSCEKTLDIKPDTSESKIVIEGVITDQARPFKVSISKTGSYFSSFEYPKVSGASVVITDNIGNVTTLYETNPGVYESTTAIQAISGRTYFLNVTVEGLSYTSSSTMPDPVAIDSIGYKKSTSSEDTNEYTTFCYLYDDQKLGNNYRFNFYKNSEASEHHVLGNDKFFNGNIIPVSFGSQKLQKGDAATIEVYSMDKAAYDYFYTLNQITDGPGNNSAPDNPISNISNGALGYFGAFAVHSKSIVIQ